MKRPIVLLVSLSVAACGITGPNNVTLNVHGTVTDASTGQPVAGANVHLYAPTIIFGTSDGDLASTTSDAQGHYTLTQSIKAPCLGNGFGYVVTATTSNPAEESEAATVSCSESSQTLDLALKPTTP
jgi:Carboxypeptidase regulatory-like domain